MAPPLAIEVEHILGMGVDRAVLASDRVYGGSDISNELCSRQRDKEDFEQSVKPDLMLFGQETIDSSTAHIGAQTPTAWVILFLLTLEV